MPCRTKPKFLSSLSSKDMELTYRTPKAIEDLSLGLNKIRSMRTIVDKNTYEFCKWKLTDRYEPENVKEIEGGIINSLFDGNSGNKFSNEDEFFYYFYISPALLLRRIFKPEGGEEEEDKHNLDYTLRDFKETLKAMNEKVINIAYEDLCITSCPDVFGFSIQKIEQILTLHSRSNVTYSIFKTILFRLYHAHRFMDECNRLANNRKASLCFQLFIDTHIDLCNYILINNVYDDQTLMDTAANMDDFLMSAYQKYYPHERRSLSYCGDLPSIIDCIDVGNIWFDIRPKFPSIVSAVIHIIVCKTQSHKCQKRNLGRILYHYCKSYPIMISLFRLITKVSLLGNYPHCNYRPEFKHRMNFYRVYDPTVLTDNIFFTWLVENEQLTRNIAAEYYIYNVSEQCILEILLDESGEWSNMKKHLIRSMDLARSVLSRGNIIDSSLFEKELKSLHQDSLKFITKLKKSNFLDMIVFSMNKYYEKNVINKKSLTVTPSESFIQEAQQKDMKLVTKKAARRYEDDSKLELKWLKCMKVTETGYNLIRRIYYDYEMKELADNAISKRLDAIYANSAYDFHLMRVYFKIISDYGIIKVHNTSYETKQKQIMAKRARMFLMPWEDTPEDADLEYYCENCKKWATPCVTDDRNEKKMINIYSQGFDKKAIYDPYSGKLCCAKQNTSVVVKKIHENGEESTDSRSARTIRRHKQQKSCRNTELKSIHMFGKVVELGGKGWAYCEVCALLIPYDGTKFNKQGYTCSMHRREGIEDRDLVLYESSKSSAAMIAVLDHPPSSNTISDMHITMMNEATDEMKELLKKYQEIDNKLKEARSVINSKHSYSDIHVCLYCNINQRQCIDSEGKMLCKIRLLDDTNIEYKYKDEYICITDFKFVQDLFLEEKIPRKSQMMQIIKSKREYSMLNVMYNPSNNNKIR